MGLLVEQAQASLLQAHSALHVVCAASYNAAMQAAHMTIEEFQTLKSRGARICALDVSLPDSIG